MSRRAQIDELIQLVLEHKSVEALKRFYHDDVVMQEADFPPRVGMEAAIAHAMQGREQTGQVFEVTAKSVLIDGDRAVIEWHAEWSMKSGQRIRVEEVALQTWKGDRIIHERFFYDTQRLVKAGLLPDLDPAIEQ